MVDGVVLGGRCSLRNPVLGVWSRAMGGEPASGGRQITALKVWAARPNPHGSSSGPAWPSEPFPPLCGQPNVLDPKVAVQVWPTGCQSGLELGPVRRPSGLRDPQDQA